MTTDNVAKEKRIHSVITLQDLITPETIIFTRTEFGRGETDYVRVYIIKTSYDDRPVIEDISWHIANASSLRLKGNGIAVGGGQYNKGLEVADTCWRIVFGQSIPQDTNWREIH